MQNLDFMVTFDVIILGMGLYIFMAAYRTKKSGVVDKLFVPDEIMVKCKDKEGLAKYLFPRIIVMGISCVAYGILALLSDTVLDLGKLVEALLLGAVLIVWAWFSYCLRTGSKPYFR